MVKHFFQLPLVRRLSGAFVGAVLALMVYGVFTTASNAVRAVLVPSPAPSAPSITAEQRNAMLKVGERARDIMEELDAQDKK